MLACLPSYFPRPTASVARSAAAPTQLCSKAANAKNTNLTSSAQALGVENPNALGCCGPMTYT